MKLYTEIRSSLIRGKMKLYADQKSFILMGKLPIVWLKESSKINQILRGVKICGSYRTKRVARCDRSQFLLESNI